MPMDPTHLLMIVQIQLMMHHTSHSESPGGSPD